MTVTVTLGVKNGASFVEECLMSLIEQTHRPLEIIVVEDSSTDGTLKCLEDWENRHKHLFGEDLEFRILAVNDLGLSASRMLAFCEARYPFVATTDIDCRPEPDWISILYDALTNVPEQVAAVTGRTRFSLGDTTTSRLRATDIERKYANRTLVTTLANGPCSMYRRSIALEVGGFEDWWYHAEDLELSLRLIEAGYAIHYVPKAVVHHVAEADLGVFLRKRARDARGHFRILRSHRGIIRRQETKLDFTGSSAKIVWIFPLTIVLVASLFAIPFSGHISQPNAWILFGILLLIERWLTLSSSTLPVQNSPASVRFRDRVVGFGIMRLWSLALWWGGARGLLDTITKRTLASD